MTRTAHRVVRQPGAPTVHQQCCSNARLELHCPHSSVTYYIPWRREARRDKSWALCPSARASRADCSLAA